MKTVICFGEILWDMLPRGLFLGGAPLNAASHLAKLGSDVWMASAVGDDFLGGESLERIRDNKVHTDFVTVSKKYPTGTVKARLDDKGNASYVFAEDVAWDHIKVTDALLKKAASADAIIYGTLAQRGSGNLKPLMRLLNVEGPLKIFDVNFRSPYDSLTTARDLAAKADIIKINREELNRLSGYTSKSARLETRIRSLSETLGIGRICVTLGGDGAIYFDHGNWVRGSAKKVKVRDTVGAGDAFLAMFTHMLITGEAEKDSGFLDRCCSLGAMVVSKDGAIPEYESKEFLR